MKRLLFGVVGLTLVVGHAGISYAQENGGTAPATTNAAPPSTAPAPIAPVATAPVVAPGVTIGGVQPSVAGWTDAVPSAYLGNAIRLTDEQVNVWLLQPRGLLDDNPRGGGDMIKFVRSLLGTDSKTVLPLVNLVKMSDVRDVQVQTIANGLASSVAESETQAPEYAAYIQWAVAQSGSNELIEAFQKASGGGEIETSALGTGAGTGPAGSPGSGSLTGVGTVGPSGPDQNTTSTVATTGGSSGSRGSSGSSSRDDEITTRLLTEATSNLAACSDPSPVRPCILN